MTVTEEPALQQADAPVLTWQEHLVQGDIDSAQAVAVRDPQLDPGVRHGLEDLAGLMALLRSKSFNRAKRHLDSIEDRFAGFDWEALTAQFDALREASGHLDERQPDEALERLQSVDLPIYQAEVRNMRGTAFIFTGDTEAARAEFEATLELDPRHYRALTNMGNAALEAGDHDAAIALYERAIALNADFPNAHHNLGVAWRKKGNISRSIRSLKAGQRAQSRFDQKEARERLGSFGNRGGSGTNRNKYLKWVLYAAAIGLVYWFLTSRGTI